MSFVRSAGTSLQESFSLLNSVKAALANDDRFPIWKRNNPVCGFDTVGILEFFGDDKPNIENRNGFSHQFTGSKFFEKCYEENSQAVLKDKEAQEIIEGATVVFDKDLKIRYHIRGVQSHEFPVIGTFVDPRIHPGFYYQVRRCGSGKTLFEKPKILEMVARGYGKRITFKGDTLNSNENYFWSDSNPAGFSFSIAALIGGEKLKYTHGRHEGHAIVSEVISDQVEISSITKKCRTSKLIKVTFVCSLKPSMSKIAYRHVSHIADVPFEGTVLLVKDGVGCAEIQRIEAVNLITGDTFKFSLD